MAALCCQRYYISSKIDTIGETPDVGSPTQKQSTGLFYAPPPAVRTASADAPPPHLWQGFTLHPLPFLRKGSEKQFFTKADLCWHRTKIPTVPRGGNFSNAFSFHQPSVGPPSPLCPLRGHFPRTAGESFSRRKAAVPRASAYNGGRPMVAPTFSE